MTNEVTDLQTTQPLPLARTVPSPWELLAGVVERGVTADNVGAVRELALLCKQMQDWDSEKAFAAAFVDLQAEMPKVRATRAVPNTDGSVRYRFAPYEDLMKQVAPYLLKHGFTVSFSMRVETPSAGVTRLVEICTLQHRGAFKRVNEFAVRIGQGPPKASESQADGAAATYAKRFALVEALNIVVEHLDNDAALEGGPITAGQAKELRRRVGETGSNEKAFLKFAGADSFETISAVKYSLLDENLRRKEATT